MDEVDRELCHLFEAARGATEPTADDRARIRTALAAKLASGIVLTSGSAHALVGSGGATAGGIVGKGLKIVLLTQVGPGLVAGMLLGGAASVLASAAATDAETAASRTTIGGTPERVASASTAATISNISEVVPRDPVTRPADSSRISASRSHAPAPPPPATCESPDCIPSATAAFSEPQSDTSELNRELAIVSRIHEAWQRGDWSGVRNAIRIHEQQFPRGTLTEEREAVKVMLSCRNVEPARAVELGDEFLRRHPGSAHAARVGAACGRKR
jgi:hypothetical protein